MEEEWNIWAEWENGETEIIDTAEDSKEADYMLGEYSIAFATSAERIWKEPA